MSVVELAKTIALDAHKGQQYIVGNEPRSYFEGHLEPVAAIVRNLGYDQFTEATAYLHDVIEDTSVTDLDLRIFGVPEQVIEAVVALTHTENEPLEKYIQRVCKIGRAIVVKFADSSVNLNSTLATKKTTAPELYKRRRAKYEYNLGILRPLLPPIEAMKS